MPPSNVKATVAIYFRTIYLNTMPVYARETHNQMFLNLIQNCLLTYIQSVERMNDQSHLPTNVTTNQSYKQLNKDKIMQQINIIRS